MKETPDNDYPCLFGPDDFLNGTAVMKLNKIKMVLVENMALRTVEKEFLYG